MEIIKFTKSVRLKWKTTAFHSKVKPFLKQVASLKKLRQIRVHIEIMFSWKGNLYHGKKMSLKAILNWVKVTSFGLVKVKKQWPWF